MLLSFISKVRLVASMARIKQTASLIEGSVYLTVLLFLFLSAMVNIMRITRSADCEAGACGNLPEGDAAQAK